MRQPPTIAIIGAGPAGLTAANILHRHGWPCQVFEADASATSRDQGGSLDLHPEDGQLALRKAGLLERFLAVARHEDQGQRVVDAITGDTLRASDGTGDRPEIDRDGLRQLLLEPLAGDIVRWNAPLTALDRQPDGRIRLEIDHQPAGVFELVIGADGAWSKVRTALTDVVPRYTGVSFAELWLEDIDRAHPAHAALIGHGTLFSLHDGAGIIAQRNGHGRVRVYAAMRTRPEEGKRPDRTLAGMGRDELLARFPGWAACLTALIRDADRITAVRPIISLPAPHGWHHQAGLTLVGDAAHVMPPLGVGVNLAMLDAAELAEKIIAGPDWQPAVQAAEQSMLARSGAISQQIIAAFDGMFSRDGHTLLEQDFDSRQA